MRDFDEASDDLGWVERAAWACGDFADEDSPTNKVRQKWTKSGSSKGLGVVLLSSSGGPDGAELGQRDHEENLADRDNEGTPHLLKKIGRQSICLIANLSMRARTTDWASYVKDSRIKNNIKRPAACHHHLVYAELDKFRNLRFGREAKVAQCGE